MRRCCVGSLQRVESSSEKLEGLHVDRGNYLWHWVTRLASSIPLKFHSWSTRREESKEYLKTMAVINFVNNNRQRSELTGNFSGHCDRAEGGAGTFLLPLV